MANQPEISEFTAGIYQYETTDEIEGGAGGKLNLPWLQLANRTKWLFDQIVALFKLAPKNRGYITGVDINGHTVGYSYATSGNITNAIITQDTDLSEVVRITMSNSMGNTNYKVIPCIQSLGSFNSDNNILPILFKPISTTQFDIILEELGTGVGNLRIHFDIISLD